MSSFSYIKDLSRITGLGLRWWKTKWSTYPDVMASLSMFFGGTAAGLSVLSYQRVTDPYRYCKFNDYYTVIREEDIGKYGEKAKIFN